MHIFEKDKGNSLETMAWSKTTLTSVRVYFHWIVVLDWIKQFTNDNSSCFSRRALASWENIKNVIILGKQSPGWPSSHLQ